MGSRIGRVNLYAMCFSRLAEHVVFRNLDRLLARVGDAITAVSTSLEADAGGDPDWFECRIDEETDVIENLLGVAFLICQTHITEVVSRVVWLRRLFEREHPGDELTTTSGSKGDILAFDGISVGSYSAVTVLDAFANYFKHREEWTGDWQKLPPQSRGTATIIESVGASRDPLATCGRVPKPWGTLPMAQSIYLLRHLGRGELRWHLRTTMS